MDHLAAPGAQHRVDMPQIVGANRIGEFGRCLFRGPVKVAEFHSANSMHAARVGSPSLNAKAGSAVIESSRIALMVRRP